MIFVASIKCRSEEPAGKADRRRGNWHPAGEGVHRTLREREPPRQLGGQGGLQGLEVPELRVLGSRAGRPGVLPVDPGLQVRRRQVTAAGSHGQLLQARPSQARKARLHGAASALPRLTRGR